MPAIARVERVTGGRWLRGPFDYRLPEELRAVVRCGSMLVVPFGRRHVLGVVVGLAERSHIAAERLLAPLRALEHGVPADLVALSGWLAREYCSTRARALGLVLAPEAARRLGGRRRGARGPGRPAGGGLPPGGGTPPGARPPAPAARLLRGRRSGRGGRGPPARRPRAGG